MLFRPTVCMSLVSHFVRTALSRQLCCLCFFASRKSHSIAAQLLRDIFRVCKANAGGDEENRTPDPLLARQVLSQLSYTPKFYTTLCYYLVSIRTTSGIVLSLSRSLSRFLLRKNTVAHGSCNVSHFAKQNAIGGPKWTRTTDLTLIRRAL